MKKLALSIALFLSFIGSAFADCAKSDFVGKWWIQDGKSISAAFISGAQTYGIAEAGGNLLLKLGDIERGAVKIYPAACRIVFFRPRNNGGDDFQSHSSPKIVEQVGIMVRTELRDRETVPAAIMLEGGATMFKRAD